MPTTAVKSKLPASFDPSVVKVVIFNGPPSSGKDEAAKFIERNAGFDTELVAFKKKLTELTCMIHGVDPYLWAERYDDHKEEPWDQLGGLSQRRALQIVSEDVIKPVYGNDYFGKATLKDIITLIENGMRVGISDCGFKEELQTLLTYFKPEELLLVRTHRPVIRLTVILGRTYIPIASHQLTLSTIRRLKTIIVVLPNTSAKSFIFGLLTMLI